jgi:hypothetical protein
VPGITSSRSDDDLTCGGGDLAVRTSDLTVLLISGIALVGCDGRGPTQPTTAKQSRSITGETFEVTGIVTDERGVPLPGAVVTMGAWRGGVVEWPSVLTDGSGRYRVSFSASPMPDGFVARAQVVAAEYDEYWRSLRRDAGATTFVENFSLSRIVRLTAGESIAFSVPPDVGECRGWVAEVCPFVYVSVPAAGSLTIETVAADAPESMPPVEVCCVGGSERYGNPITIPVAPGPDLEVKVGLRRGFSTTQTFLVKTTLETFQQPRSR